MFSSAWVWQIVLAVGLAGSFASAGLLNQQESIHFTRTSSSSQSTSSTSSSTTSVTTSGAGQAPVVKSFPLGQDGVTCEHRSYGVGNNNLQNVGATSGQTYSSGPSRQIANLTPYQCHVQCSPYTPTSPNKYDCEKIINTMRNSRQGTVIIEPQTWLYVSYKECAVVLENQNSQNLAVVYDWRLLADQASRLQAQCSVAPTDAGYASSYHSKSTGTCFFASCDLTNAARSNSSPRRYSDNPRANNGNVEDSGISINFQRNVQGNFN